MGRPLVLTGWASRVRGPPWGSARFFPVAFFVSRPSVFRAPRIGAAGRGHGGPYPCKFPSVISPSATTGARRITDLSLSLDTRWRLGFVGRNGRGKTTLLRLLAGELDPRGAVTSPLAMDYFPFSLPPDAQTLPAREAVRRMARDPEIPDWQILREAGLLEIDPAVLEQPLSTLSGGERTKLMLISLFLRQNNFLLIDEPTGRPRATGAGGLPRPGRERIHPGLP